ncbi:4Fe-4S dicluster domain-containing protein [Methanothermococcus sp.]|uniref:4Fe-4S dicluster domain-containing protein n=1 Tax=Methanothermococcus sp. TaxID=2614238 RepID=UPI0025E032B9|nr:4Fe-4S binding protein [Methanothermococcus sp.]
MKLMPNVKLCVSCGRCERICPLNGIFVVDGIPLKCMHCEDAPCMKACPENALIRLNDKVVVDKKKCIGCGICIEACPFGAIRMDYNTKTIFKCNGGAKKEVELCKMVCPTGALDYSENTIENKQKELISKLKKIYSYI